MASPLPEADLGCGEGSVLRGTTARITIRVMQAISLKLPDDLLAQLSSEAKARGVTKSWLVRESLERALRKSSPEGALSCYDLARDLAGAVKGLPKDLADNPKYMQGFGR
ncbi:MAG TPA: CopG family transcriptional regulator [Bryobacteraceae bacterium]|nr:CopG family transcriptional regulator [Bryobacteraceae bacterium]